MNWKIAVFFLIISFLNPGKPSNSWLPLVENIDELLCILCGFLDQPKKKGIEEKFVVGLQHAVFES